MHLSERIESVNHFNRHSECKHTLVMHQLLQDEIHKKHPNLVSTSQPSTHLMAHPVEHLRCCLRRRILTSHLKANSSHRTCRVTKRTHFAPYMNLFFAPAAHFLWLLNYDISDNNNAYKIYSGTSHEETQRTSFKFNTMVQNLKPNFPLVTTLGLP